MRHILLSALTTLPAILPAMLPGAVMAEVPQVVTDIPPVAALVAQVMGDLGAPVLLLEKGADEHDFQLRPSQMAAIEKADLMVWIGPELTPWLDRALAGGSAPALALLAVEGSHLQEYQTETSADPAGHDHDAAGDPDEDGHAHAGIDPHAWLDPANARLWLLAIAGELARRDPEHAATYAANAETARAQVAALEGDLAARLAPLAGKRFVTFHAAYGYFTGHFGLDAAASLSLGDASAPGAARLAALQAEVQAGHYLCAFPEVQHDPGLLQQVLAGSAVRMGGALDPVGSGQEPGPGAHGALMTAIADTLIDCLGR